MNNSTVAAPMPVELRMFGAISYLIFALIAVVLNILLLIVMYKVRSSL